MSMLLRIYPGDAWGLLVANVLVQVTVIILSAWLLARLCSRWNAAVRHSIYLVAIICVLAAPVLSMVMPTTGIALLRLRPSASTVAPVVATAEPASIPMVYIAESSPVEAPTLAPALVAADRVPLDAENLGQGIENPAALSFSDILRALAAVTLVVWLLGVAVLLARWCYGLRLIAGLRRTAQPLDSETVTKLLPQVRRALGTERLPPLAVSADLDRPVMVGLIRPLVILPQHALRTLNGRDLGDILVHECAHAVCRHHVVGFLQRVVGVLFWPHPLVHLLNRELARAREEVCDNYVLCHSDAPRYAQTLLELSQMLNGVSLKPAALGLFFHCPWRLEDRVADLLDRRRRAMTRVNRLTAAALTVTFLLLTLLIAGTTIVQAEPATEEKVVDVPASSASSDQSPTATADPTAENAELIHSAGNLYDIMSAIHMYHDVAERYPAAGYGWGYDKKAKKWFRHRPNLSWRVQLLPLLGKRELFDKFRSGEPWDSEHNRKLIPLMPKIYRAPGSKAGVGKTNYLGIVGPGAAFPDKGMIAVPDFTDGTSNTIMLVEVPDEAAVEWTKPEDFPIDTKKPVKKLVGLRKKGFLTAFADGSPRFISEDITPKMLRLLLIRNDGSVINYRDLKTIARELTLAVKRSRSQPLPPPPPPAAVEKKDLARVPPGAWQMSIDLDMPSLVSPAVQFALFDKDPISAFKANIRRRKSYYRRDLEMADNETRKERARASQMMATWNIGFREVTGDRLSLLIDRPGGGRSISIAPYTYTAPYSPADKKRPGVKHSDTTAPSDKPADKKSPGVSHSKVIVAGGGPSVSANMQKPPPPKMLSKKKWIVTKAARNIKGKYVCWCIPVEVKTGGAIQVILNESNTFDLKAAYDEAMKEDKETEPGK